MKFAEIKKHSTQAGVAQLSAQERDATARTKIVRCPLMPQQGESQVESSNFDSNELELAVSAPIRQR